MLLAVNQPTAKMFFVSGVEFPPYASFRPETAQSINYTISKNGGAFANPFSGAVVLTDMGDGFYYTTLLPQDTDTLGILAHKLSWGGGGFLLGEIDQVVPELPGGPATLLVSERIAIAQTLLQLPDGVELGLTPRNALRVLFAVLAGKSAAGLGNVLFRNFGDTKNRVSVTYDRTSSRIVVTYDFS